MFWIVATGADGEVKLRTSVDGWDTDLHGEHGDGGWTFTLDGIRYAGGLEFKFRIDGGWFPGENFYLAPAPGGRYDYGLDLTSRPRAAADSPPAPPHVCSGVVGTTRPAALDVDILHREVGGETVLASTRTDATGRYEVALDLGDGALDLQARVSGNGTELGRSPIRYGACGSTTLDVTLPASAPGLLSEFETTTTVLASVHPASPARLRVATDSPDIGYLAGKSGLDPDLIALTAAAGRLTNDDASVPGGQPVPSALYYALLRAGAPAESSTLYLTSPQIAADVWARAAAEGVVPAIQPNELRDAVERFTSLATRALPDARAFPGGSTVRDLAGRMLDGDQLADFAGLLVRHRQDPDDLWGRAREAFGPETAAGLRLDGSLAYLTLDNAPLIGRLHEAEPDLGGLPDLARRGYHQAEAWLPLIGDDLPGPVTGTTPDARRLGYARMLAAQVAIAEPTLSVAPLAPTDAARDFLLEHHAGFDISSQPIGQYLARNPEIAAEPEVRDPITRLQLLYQISPGQDALIALTQAGVSSARELADQSEEQVLATFGSRIGTDTARLMHEKAREVSGAVTSLASAFLTARQAPAVAGAFRLQRSGTVPADYPTLEELFGSLDFCACADCRSVLSPAAYLVDLLQFLDRPVDGISAQRVLLDRRPDLQHLALTCENTNTVLPAVDVVNETLEHFVAHGLTLDGYRGHDTDPDVPSEDLLASPSYVEEAAYDALRTAAYPPPLPFHRPLETVRRYLELLGTTLPRAMQLLLRDDSPLYSAEDVLLERFGISRDQRDLLTDPADLTTLYGFPAGAEPAVVRAELHNVAGLLRRLRIGYDDLTDLLATHYVNPDAALLPAVTALRIDLADLWAWQRGELSTDDLRGLLPAELDQAPYGGDVIAWLGDDARQDRIRNLVTVRPAADGDPCTLEGLELRRTDASDPPDEVFVRMMRLHRLAGHLGWPIDRCDTAITALMPDGIDTPGLARLGAVVDALDRLKLRADRDLDALLTCWAPMPAALYDRLFLRPAPITDDGTFDRDADGRVLTDSSRTVTDAVRAACNLSADDWTLLAQDGVTLNLHNVSSVYRKAWLVRVLRIGLADLLSLIDRSGIDPFAPPDPPAPITALLDLVDGLRTAGLTPAAALTLIGSELLVADVPDLVTALRRAAPGEEPAAPGAANGRPEMAALLGAADSGFLFGILDATQPPLTATYPHADATLGAAIDVAARGRLGYDATAGGLIYPTLLTPATADALRAVPGVTDAFVRAVDDLLAESDARFGPFLDRYETLRAPVGQYLDGTLSEAALIEIVLADLRARSIAQRAAVITAAALGLGDLADVLMHDPDVLHADADPNLPAVQDMIAVRRTGLTLTAPGLVDETAGLDWTSPGAALPTARWTGEIELAAAGDYAFRLETDPRVAFSLTLGTAATWSGTTDANGRANGPGTPLGAGRVTIDLTADDVTRLRLSLRTGPAQGWQPVPRETLCSAVLLDRARRTAARLVRAVTLARALRLTGSDLVRFAPAVADSQPWRETVTGLLAYTRIRDAAPNGPADLGPLLDAPEATLPRGDLVLAARLGWSTPTVLQLLGHFGLAVADLGKVGVLDRIGPAVSVVRDCGIGVPVLAAVLSNDPGLAVVQVFQAGLRARFDRDALLDALKRAHDELRVARRDALVAHVLQRLSADPATRHVDTRDKLFELFLMDTEMDPCGQTTRIRHALSSIQIFVDRCLMGLEAGAEFPRFYRLFNGTDHFYTTSAAERDSAVDGGYLLEGVEGHPFDDLAPGTVPLFRLVHPQTGDHFYTANEPEVSSAIQVSGYRGEGIACWVAPDKIDGTMPLYRLFRPTMADHFYTTSAAERASAIEAGSQDEGVAAYVRTAGQTGVSPRSIDARRWEWMKRYRVWEANRKLFLFRENWLAPELRTDQSVFFREVMSDLLQGDITEERAATAMITYLSRLEEVAQLEPCGLEFVPAGPGAADAVLHLVARSSGARRAYFYRRREGVFWTPWEPVKLEIEDDPVQPVVWNDRLFLFWLRITQKSPVDPTKMGTGTTPDAQGALGAVTVGALKEDARTAAENSRVVVEALLCWSEYVNGAWQPAKHSDPLRPTRLTELSPGAPPYDRTKTKFWPVHHEGNLVLFVQSPDSGDLTSFTFYNSYSEPARQEDVPTPFTRPDRWRFLNPSRSDSESRLFAIYINELKAEYGWLIVSGPTSFRVSQAIGYAGDDSTNWPFFVNDSRRGYFVTSNQEPATLRTFQGFGRVLPTLSIPHAEPLPREAVGAPHRARPDC
jgi:Neuraminidase-like domain/Repeat of unknown function (DUF5648)/Salmonella virulence plasmid 28.1kDa A protein